MFVYKHVLVRIQTIVDPYTDEIYLRLKKFMCSYTNKMWVVYVVFCLYTNRNMIVYKQKFVCIQTIMFVYEQICVRIQTN